MTSVSSRLPPTGSATVNPRATGLDGGVERGSAFRGSSRGRGGRGGGDRGRGGRAGARGGGSGRGGRAASSSGSEMTPRGALSSARANGVPSDGFSSKSDGLAASSDGARSAMPKLPYRRASQQPGSRRPPALNIEPASPITDRHEPPASASSKTAPRRKRSHQPKFGLSTSAKPIPIEVAVAALRPQATRKASTGPSSPHDLVKDAPPHLSAGANVQTFDMKSNIDTLVERVRAIAMERPHSPGSHIDWAGDDDDTLPDLDDWGVNALSTGTIATTMSEPARKIELMSPILDDSLKQLPIHDDKSKSPSVNEAVLSPNTLPPDITGEDTLSQTDDAVEAVVQPPKPVESVSDKTPQVQPIVNRRSTKSSPAATQTPTAVVTSRAPLHPSLPPKPTSTFEVTKTRSPLAPNGNELSAKLVAVPIKPSVAESVPTGSPTKSTIGSEKTPRADIFSTNRPGLEASMHAPKTTASEPVVAPLVQDEVQQSSPKANIPPPANVPPFNPSHGRSRTLGRPTSGAAPARPFKSGGSTPNISAMQHARTQSSPPPVATGRHARQGSRPVIASTAISSLKKTLGGSGPTPRKQPPPSTTSSATSSE